jgi:transposase-like protein
MDGCDGHYQCSHCQREFDNEPNSAAKHQFHLFEDKVCPFIIQR